MSRFKFVAALGGKLLAAGLVSAQSPTLSLWVTEVNGVPCPSCPTRNLPETEVAPGDVIRVDAFIEGWDALPFLGVCNQHTCSMPGTALDCDLRNPAACGDGRHCARAGNVCDDDADCPHYDCVADGCVASPQIGSYQWTLDSSSLASGRCGELAPARIPCRRDDCANTLDGACPCAQFHEFSVMCTCAFNGSCNVSTPDGDFCDPQGSAFIELIRPDFLFYGIPILGAVNAYASPDYEWACVALSGATLDPQSPRYLGTVLLQASPNAQGTFTVSMLDDPGRTLVNDACAVPLSRTLEPVVIDFPRCCPGVDCNDGNSCTVDCVSSCETCTCIHHLQLCPPECLYVCPGLRCNSDADCYPPPNPCLSARCLNGLCWSFNNTDPCDDADACTVGDQCAGGVCCGTPVDCGPEAVCDPLNGTCEPRACAFIAGADDCKIDARQPHPINDPSVPQGSDSFSLQLADADCAFSGTPSDFELSVVPDPMPPGLAIAAVSLDEGTVSVRLNRIIPTGRWTCITHMPSGHRVCSGALPGDVNQSGMTNAQDITAIVDALTGAVPRPPHATDINRSGAANAQDITALVNLLNGAGAFDPWLGATIPVPCPSE